MLREVELATARAAHVSIQGSGCYPGAVATFTLPVSKTDPQAFGAVRSHKCRCVGRASPNCPVHALMDQLSWLNSLSGPVHVPS